LNGHVFSFFAQKIPSRIKPEIMESGLTPFQHRFQPILPLPYGFFFSTKAVFADAIVAFQTGPRNQVITYLHGKLAESLPTQVVVEVGGVGYEVLIPLSSYDRLPPPGTSVKILTHLVVREDAHILFGFMTADERDLFRLLVQHVSGIGPKIALAVLSGIAVPAFKGAVVNGEVKTLAQIRGVGKKTAERIIVELKDKIGVAGAWEAASAKHALTPEEQKCNDAVLALISLGYKQIEAHKAIRAASEKLGPAVDVEQLVREALRQA
jgi:Holliday junction DNA helicase RuvA